MTTMYPGRKFWQTSTPLGYLAGVLAIGVSTALLIGLSLTPIFAVLFYLCGIAVIAWRWGTGVSMVSSLLAFLAFNYFFIEPHGTLHVEHPEDWVSLFFFLLEGLFISYWVHRAYTAVAQARLRESEATHLYELSFSLGDLRRTEEVGLTLARHLYDVFNAEVVEVEISSGLPRALKAYRYPAGVAAMAAPPSYTLSLDTPRGRLGKISLWGTTPQIDLSLLNTFANLGALALERLTLAQSEARAQILEETDRLKTSLLSSVSHELRTPLATIKAAATSLRGGEVSLNSPASHDLIMAIDEETDQLTRLVGNLLDMSRIEAGVLKPKKEWNVLAEILSAVLKRMKRAAENHLLEINVSEELPLVAVDYDQVSQVFTNLLSNCIKYAPSHTSIQVQAHPNADFTWMNVQVSNQGPSVPEEHLPHIFDKFYRVTAADRVTGTGLGLSICKGIIEAHGGHIWAENLPQGFAFNFTLPLTWDGARPKVTYTE